MNSLIQETIYYDFIQNNIEPEIVIVAEQNNDLVCSSMYFRDTSNSATLHNEESDNLLSGKNSKDTLRGGSGDDRLFASDGDDLLIGGDGNDCLYGEDGNDTLYGETNSDTLFGGFGNDKLFGGRGDDYLNGNNGNDYLRGGFGSDTLIGEEGEDILAVTNDDLLNINDTDSEKDTILFRSNGKNTNSIFAVVEGFSNEDCVRLEIGIGDINYHYTTDNGTGDTLLYISHDEGYLSVIKFNNIGEDFVSDRIETLY